MNDLMNQVASSGDLAACLPETRVMLAMFIFAFIVIVTCSIFIALKNFGGKG